MQTKIIGVNEPTPKGYSPFVRIETPTGTRRADEVMQFGLAGEQLSRESNIRKAVARGLPRVAQGAPSTRALALACYGPSLTTGIEEIRYGEWDIWTTSKANGLLTRNGLHVNRHVEIDPRPFKRHILADASPRAIYYLASRCAPAMFDAAPGPIELFHLNVSEELAVLDEVAPGESRIPTAVVAGVCAMQVAYHAGYRRFEVFGMDCSYAGDEDAMAKFDREHGGEPVSEALRQTMQSHAGPHPTSNRPVQIVSVRDRYFLTDSLMLLAVNDFFGFAFTHPDVSWTLHGDGLLQTAVRESLGIK